MSFDDQNVEVLSMKDAAIISKLVVAGINKDKPMYQSIGLLSASIAQIVAQIERQTHPDDPKISSLRNTWAIPFITSAVKAFMDHLAKDFENTDKDNMVF